MGILSAFGIATAQERPVSDIYDLRDKVKAELDAKEEAYNLAKEQLNIFQEKKSALESKLKSASFSNDPALKRKYKTALSNLSMCETDVSISRSSYINSILYFGKINSRATLESAMFA